MNATLTWTPIHDVIGYAIDYKKSVDENFIVFDIVQTDSCLIEDLEPNTEYDFRITTLCLANESQGVIITSKTPEG